MVQLKCGDDVAKKLEITHCRMTLFIGALLPCHWISKEQLVSSIKQGGKYSVQIDESTDISGYAQLLVYVRYLGESTSEEEFLFCRALETITRGNDIFALVDSFMKEEGLEWDI